MAISISVTVFKIAWEHGGFYKPNGFILSLCELTLLGDLISLIWRPDCFYDVLVLKTLELGGMFSFFFFFFFYHDCVIISNCDYIFFKAL